MRLSSSWSSTCPVLQGLGFQACCRQGLLVGSAATGRGWGGSGRGHRVQAASPAGRAVWVTSPDSQGHLGYTGFPPSPYMDCGQGQEGMNVYHLCMERQLQEQLRDPPQQFSTPGRLGGSTRHCPEQMLAEERILKRWSRGPAGDQGGEYARDSLGASPLSCLCLWPCSRGPSSHLQLPQWEQGTERAALKP